MFFGIFVLNRVSNLSFFAYWRKAKPDTFRLFDQIWHFLKHFNIVYDFLTVSRIVWAFLLNPTELQYILLEYKKWKITFTTCHSLDQTPFCQPGDIFSGANHARKKKTKKRQFRLPFSQLNQTLNHGMLEIHDVIGAGKHASNEVRIDHWMERDGTIPLLAWARSTLFPLNIYCSKLLAQLISTRPVSCLQMRELSPKLLLSEFQFSIENNSRL